MQKRLKSKVATKLLHALKRKHDADADVAKSDAIDEKSVAQQAMMASILKELKQVKDQLSQPTTMGSQAPPKK